jgi:hypothetical protein
VEGELSDLGITQACLVGRHDSMKSGWSGIRHNVAAPQRATVSAG